MYPYGFLSLAIAALTACGGGGGGDPPPPTVVGTEPRLEIFAGAFGGSGAEDGPTQFARLNHPAGVAADAAGRIIIADTHNRTVRRISADGQVSTLAGSTLVVGFADGQGSAARFNYPWDVVVDRAGNAYVSDLFNHSIRKITPEGMVTTLAGTNTSGFSDGAGSQARFNQPAGIGIDSNGNLYVADQLNNAIRAISPSGVVTTVAGGPGANQASVDGPVAVARFAAPRDVAVDRTGILWVTDSRTIRRISLGVVSTAAGLNPPPGSGIAPPPADGPAASARFSSLMGIDVDASGNVLVTDSHAIRKLDAAGMVTTLAGPLDSAGQAGSADGQGAIARFRSPFGHAFESSGSALVADYDNNTIRRVSPQGSVTTLIGTVDAQLQVDGPRAVARFVELRGGTFDGQGNLVLVDRVSVRRVAPDGTTATIATVTPAGLSSTSLTGIALAPNGDFLLPTTTCPIFPIGPAPPSVLNCTNTVTRLGTSGSLTTLGGFSGPGRISQAIAVDSAGTMFIADADRDFIRRVAADGSTVTTLAGIDDSCPALGTPPPLADGPTGTARFCTPTGVALDTAGNVYVADGRYFAIRKITPAGVVTTLAGGAGDNCAAGSGSGDGVGAAARFCALRGLAVDSAGVIYVADGHTVRRVSPAGEVTTIAGVARISGMSLGTPPGLLSTVMGVIPSGRDLYIVLPNSIVVLRNRP